MNGQVQFYVNGIHSVGGVTTWSFQAATFLANQYRTQVVTVNNGVQNNEDLFPGQVMKIWRRTSQSSSSSDDGNQDQSPGRPQKPAKPTKPARPERRVRKPVKPTKPTKIPIEPPEFPDDDAMVGQFDVAVATLDADVDNPSSNGFLHRSAEKAIDEASLFVPNYLDFAYDLAARSRVQGIASRCIGICHCDQENYYRLLTHYAPIIQSFIAVSPRCLKRLSERLPDRVADMHLMPYGVEPPAEQEYQLQSGPRYGAAMSGPIRLLYSGRLARKQKRIFDLVAIVRELDARGVDYILDIVGVGPDRECLVEAFVGASRVRFYPGVSHNEIGQIYQGHDVFLLPSETEGTSIALLESMAHGLVPIVTRVSGSEDVVIDGENGFLCEVGDIRSMAARIEELSNERTLLGVFSNRAQETIARSYRKESQLKEFAECVRQTLQKPLVSVEAASSVLEH
jgi:glycosyltransferase involved in cell wall biosynthesis